MSFLLQNSQTTQLFVFEQLDKAISNKLFDLKSSMKQLFARKTVSKSFFSQLNKTF